MSRCGDWRLLGVEGVREPTVPRIIFRAVPLRAAHFCKSHSHKFHEKQRKNGHKGNPFWPWIRRDRAGQAFIRERLVGGCKQLRGVNENSKCSSVR